MSQVFRQRGGLITMTVRDALDEPVQEKPPQAIGHSANGVLGWIETQQLSRKALISRFVNPRSWRLNQTNTANRACTCASPKRNADARCPLTRMGRTTFSNASSPIAQSWETVWTSSRRRLA